jgi:hypothetical protein
MVRDILLHHVAYANPYRLREPISLTRQLTSVPAGKVMMDGTPQYIDNGKDGFKVDGAIESCSALEMYTITSHGGSSSSTRALFMTSIHFPA